MWYFESKISCFGGDLGLPCLDYVGEIVFSELNQNFPSVFIAVLVVNITRHAICFAVVLIGGGSFFFLFSFFYSSSLRPLCYEIYTMDGLMIYLVAKVRLVKIVCVFT